MEFVLIGFRQEKNIRRYAFDAVSSSHVRTHVTVGADLSLARAYRIPLQELPLLCRRLLEDLTEAQTAVPAKVGTAKSQAPKNSGLASEKLMYTEKEMLGYARDRAVAETLAEQKRRAHRVPITRRNGSRPGAQKAAILED
jgi:hypothetical protein